MLLTQKTYSHFKLSIDSTRGYSLSKIGGKYGNQSQIFISLYGNQSHSMGISLEFDLFIQRLDTSNNPNLEMPPKPKVEVPGAGPEFYHIDFDSKLLQQGAVVTSSKIAKSKSVYLYIHLIPLFLSLASYTKQKVRFIINIVYKKYYFPLFRKDI